MKEVVTPNTKVIYLVNGNITALDICPAGAGLPPERAFANDNVLHTKLTTLNPPDQKIAIVCFGIFGEGNTNLDAILALQGYNLTIIAKSISQDFHSYFAPIQSKLIECGSISADNVNVDDEIEIQGTKMIQKRRIHNYDIVRFKSSESSDDDVEATQE
jgi:hypothetical protein